MRRLPWLVPCLILCACDPRGRAQASRDHGVEASQASATVVDAGPVDEPDAGRSARLVVSSDCSGKPCAKAEVTVSFEQSSSSKYLDSRGEATFIGLRSGEALVRVQDDTNQRHPIVGEEKVKLTPGATARVTVRTRVLTADATIYGFMVERDGSRASILPGTVLVVEAFCQSFQRKAEVRSSDASFSLTNLLPGECMLDGTRFNDPPGPLDGNGAHVTTKVTAPAAGVKVQVNNFSSLGR